MINGNVSEFVDHIYYGDELVFLYQEQKFFLQGFFTNGTYTLYLDRWEPISNDYIWIGVGDAHNYPVEEFLNAKLWGGKSFWEVEKEIEWVDC